MNCSTRDRSAPDLRPPGGASDVLYAAELDVPPLLPLEEEGTAAQLRARRGVFERLWRLQTEGVFEEGQPHEVVHGRKVLAGSAAFGFPGP
jgi:hypothetical protein